MRDGYSSLTDDRELYSGLIRLHVLHHASEEPIFGLGMVAELARQAYHISPDTLYEALTELGKTWHQALPVTQGLN